MSHVPSRASSRKPLMTTARALALAALACVTSELATAGVEAETPFALVSPPDLVLTGGRVKTPTGWAEALAVRDGLIVAVGTNADVDRLRGRLTRVIELGGATVLPGLHDTHVHPMNGGFAARACSIPVGSSLPATVESVKQCVSRAKPGTWIDGSTWDAPALGGVPDKSSLDAVSKDNPVLLHDSSHHSLWVNSAALAAAGITRDTPNPPGGIIERSANGEPTGVLRESAGDLVESRMPPPTQADTEAALEYAANLMLSVGVTSFTDAYVGLSEPDRALAAYASLADRGVLKQHARLCIRWLPGHPELDTVIEARNRYARANVTPDCVKLVLDGVPIDSQTAAMIQPYAGTVAGRNDAASRRGLLQFTRPELEAAVTRFDAMGLTVKMHAAGDLSARAALDAIAVARKTNGVGPTLHNVAHNTFVAPNDIARARSIGAVFEVSPYLFSPSPIVAAIITAVGPERSRRAWPVREMLDAGALVVPGSDWNVVPSVDPWIAIETLVTREEPGGSEQTFGKDEAITVAEALDLFTVNAARQAGVAHRVGRIEPGMVADVIVVSQNPYEVEPRKIHETRVRMTFISGERVYEAQRLR